MKESALFFLMRFFIITTIYCVERFIWGFGIFLSYYFFVPALALHLFFCIKNFRGSEKKEVERRVTIDIIFLILFALETIYLFFWMMVSLGEAGFGIVEMIFYTPMVALFIVWLTRDMKELRKM